MNRSYEKAQEDYDNMLPEDVYGCLLEDNLNMTFTGTDENLNTFLKELEDVASELAKKYNVEID